MPKAIRLTQELISKLDAPGVYWDDLISGFAVSVYKSGTKSFLLKYRERGRQRWETIGKVGIVNCEQAREMAARLLAKVKVLKPTARVNMTVKEFCRYYLARYAEPRKKTWKLDEGRCRLYIEPRLGHLRLDQVTRADIARLHEDIGREKPVESNRVREQISKMWKLAKIWEILPDDFPNITLGIEDFKEQERTRYFTSAEIERLAASIDQERDVHVRSAFWLLLLTGLRRNEVLNMMWDDIDFEIPALKLKGKNGQVTWQHLSTPALMVLKHCPRKENNPYVVCGTSPGKSRNNIQKAWKRISDHAGLK
ncbi:MAG: integrase family protein, partial [Candidatus Obscuribacterales bacterium]|nr:integrase family protein [Candidatus Obscuribacterales bacterium]